MGCLCGRCELAVADLNVERWTSQLDAARPTTLQFTGEWPTTAADADAAAAAAATMSDHEELVADLTAAERMSAADRLKAARKKRMLQLKKFQQYERQLDKETSRRAAASAPTGGRKKSAAKPAQPRQQQRTTPRVRFVSNVVVLEAAARNDIDEGIIWLDCSLSLCPVSVKTIIHRRPTRQDDVECSLAGSSMGSYNIRSSTQFIRSIAYSL